MGCDTIYTHVTCTLHGRNKMTHSQDNFRIWYSATVLLPLLVPYSPASFLPEMHHLQTLRWRVPT